MPTWADFMPQLVRELGFVSETRDGNSLGGVPDEWDFFENYIALPQCDIQHKTHSHSAIFII